MNSKDPEFGPMFESAMAARDRRDFETAKALCNEMIRLLDQTERRMLSAIHAQLGYIHRLEGDFDSAERHARASVLHAPHVELASLGLFHVYASKHKWRQALEEAVRFLRNRNSPEYHEMLFTPGYGVGLDTASWALLEEARRLLRAHLKRN